MAARKSPVTRPGDASVEGFLARVPSEQRREDARRLCAMMQEITGEPPAMWGANIVGFGTYHYRYASGHEGDAPLAGSHPAASIWSSIWPASSVTGTSRCWRGWARTRAGRAVCTSSASVTWTTMRCAS